MPRQISEKDTKEVIEALERALNDARKGKTQGLVLLAFKSDKTVDYAIQGCVMTHSLVFHLESMKTRIIMEKKL